jgi:hypothetical protein
VPHGLLTARREPIVEIFTVVAETGVLLRGSGGHLGVMRRGLGVPFAFFAET